MDKMNNKTEKLAQATMEYFAIMIGMSILTVVIISSIGTEQSLFSKVRSSIVNFFNGASEALTRDNPGGDDPFEDDHP